MRHIAAVFPVLCVAPLVCGHAELVSGATVAELLVNLVKESLLSMVRIMFAHAGRLAVSAQTRASGASLYTSAHITVHGSSNSLGPINTQDSYGESSERLQGGRLEQQPMSNSNRVGMATGESIDESTAVGVVGQGKQERGSEGYGQPAAGHILLFLIKLARVDPMRGFALDLIQEAVAAGGRYLLQMPLLMSRLQVSSRSHRA
jgi:hypothetical protein